jgi:hypothetical protein
MGHGGKGLVGEHFCQARSDIAMVVFRCVMQKSAVHINNGKVNGYGSGINAEYRGRIFHI